MYKNYVHSVVCECGVVVRVDRAVRISFLNTLLEFYLILLPNGLVDFDCLSVVAQ